MNAKSNFLTVFFLAFSLTLLVPGITQPMLTITGTMDKAKLKDTGVDLLAESLIGAPSADPQQQANAHQKVKRMLNGMASLLGMSEVSGQIKAYEKTRSILGTVEDLYHSGNVFVALMVGLFSVVIPTIKVLMMVVMTTLSDHLRKQTLRNLNSAMSKWSMADVFVIALIVTYMAANASSNTGLLEFQSSFESGFYYFLAYCLFSIAASQILQRAAIFQNIAAPANSLTQVNNQA